MTHDYSIYWWFFIVWIQQILRRWTKPASVSIISGALLDLQRNRTDLIAENALLRQQLIVLNRHVKRPQLTHADHVELVILSKFTRFWKQALHIVEPATLLRWHRELFRFYWRRKSRRKQNQPKISSEIIELIRKMANENRMWGADRIRGELLKLDIPVCKRTIQKYMPKTRKSLTSNPTWATFKKNHARDLWVIDFAVAYDWLFRAWYVFVVIELRTRRIIHMAVTQTPSDAWTAQPLRQATPWNKSPKYLLHDRDCKYGRQFSTVAASSGIIELRTPYRAPQANGVCERFVGSLRRECLDHMLILNGRQLQRVVKEYSDYFNQERPHQGIGQHIPNFYDQPNARKTGRITSKAILGGLHHSYSREI